MDRVAFNAMVAQYATPEVSGDGRVSWDGGVRCVIPSVKLYGVAVQDGTPTPDAPVMLVCNNGVFRATNADGTFDGGQAVAPELYAIPGTKYWDEWNPQTGRGIRRVKKLILDGTEPWEFTDVRGRRYAIYLPSMGLPVANSVCGLCTHFNRRAGNDQPWGYYYASYFVVITDNGSCFADLESFKSWLKEQCDAGTPVTILYAILDESNYTSILSTPARLTMPSGPGQIIQTGGDVTDCPITARYVTHS